MKRGVWIKALMVALALTLTLSAKASIDVYEFDSLQQEAQYQALINDFRCPTCQNQNLAGSDAPIAQDLKQKTYEMVKDGRSDAEIRAYMTERYGDFISYKPPVRPSTWLLWFFPPLLLLLLIVAWLLRVRKKTAKDAQVSPDETRAPLSADEEARLAKLLGAHDAAINPKQYQSLNQNQPKDTP